MATVKTNGKRWKIVINTLLDENLMSQKELAVRCRVSAQTVSNWLNDVRNPGVYAKRHIMELIDETKGQRDMFNKLMHPLADKHEIWDRNKEKFVKLIAGMSKTQQKKLMGTMSKMDGRSKQSSTKQKRTRK